MALQTLSIDLNAKVAEFAADMNKAASVSQQTGRQIASGLGLVKSAVGGLAAAFSFNLFAQLAKDAINSIDALNDVRDATGATIENISALEDVAARTGTSFETVSAALIKFNKNLVDAKPGSDLAQAFESLGLSLDRLKQQDPAEALRSTAAALAGYADDGRKARLETVLFGEQVKNVAPFLKNLGEAGDLVAKVTTKQAEEAERFNRALLGMQKNSQDLVRESVSPLVTWMTKLIEKLEEARKAGNFLWSSMAKELDKELARRSANYTGDFFTAGGGRGRVNPELVRASVLFDPGKDKDKKVPLQRAKADLADNTQRELDQYIESLKAAIERTQDLTEVERARLRIAETGARGFSEAKREYVLGLAAQLDGAKELTKAEADRIRFGRQAAIEAGDRVTEENRSYRERLQLLTDGAASNVFKRQQEDLQFLQDALAKNAIDTQVYAESVRNLFNITSDGLAKVNSFAEEAAKNIQASLGSGLADILNGNFDNIGKSFTQLINRMVAEAAAAKITESLFGKGGDGSGLFGNVLGTIGKYLFGGFKAGHVP